MFVINRSDCQFPFPVLYFISTTLSLNKLLLLLWLSMHGGTWCVFSTQTPTFQRLMKNLFLCWSTGTATTIKTGEERGKKQLGLSGLRKANGVLKLFWNYFFLLVSLLPNRALIEVHGIFATEINKDIMEHCWHHCPAFSLPFLKRFPSVLSFLVFSFNESEHNNYLEPYLVSVIIVSFSIYIFLLNIKSDTF